MLLRYMHDVSKEMSSWSDGPKYLLMLDSEPDWIQSVKCVFGDHCLVKPKHELLEWIRNFQKTKAVSEFIVLEQEVIDEARVIRPDLIFKLLSREG